MPPPWLPVTGGLAIRSLTQDTSDNVLLHYFRRYKLPELTADETYALHIASITPAAVSMAAGLVVLQWLLRMNRGFRHE